MDETNERTTPVTVNVKALANFFSTLHQDNGKPCDLVVPSAIRSNGTATNSVSSRLSAEQLGLSSVVSEVIPAATTSTQQDDSEEKQLQSRQCDQQDKEHKIIPPVPLPRISLIRKQTAYGSSFKPSDQSIYCDISDTSHDDDCLSHRTDDCGDDLDDIYEEIPDTHYMSQPDLQGDMRNQSNSFKNDPINRKLSASLQKLKCVLQRSIGDDVRRKGSLFQFKNRDSKDRKLPKPPSVEQLERPYRSSPQNIYQNKTNGIIKEKENCDYYYDVQEINSNSSGSDDYYICIDDDDDLDVNEDDGYEEVIHPVSPEPFSTGKTYDNTVQYAEIDPVQTLELEKRIEKEQKRFERRQREQADKWRKKFNLTGQEVPVNYGTVKADVGRSRSNRLRVKKGEIILVLRMEGNPPGLYLAKNERSEVGYVELCNIEFDPESIKAIMRVETEVGAS